MAKSTRTDAEETLRNLLRESLLSHDLSVADILRIVADCSQESSTDKNIYDRNTHTTHTSTALRARAPHDLKETQIPLSIFAHEHIGALELIVFYLREYLSLPFSAISSLLGRPSSSLRRPYSQAKKKLTEASETLTIPPRLSDPEIYTVPATLFADRSVSVQRHLVRYLHDTLSLPFSEIARFLARNPRTIWTAYHATQGNGETMRGEDT